MGAPPFKCVEYPPLSRQNATHFGYCRGDGWMAEYSISITDLTRKTKEQNPMVRTLLGDLDKDPANKKVICVIYVSLGEAAREQLEDMYPHTATWKLKAQHLLTLCDDCFQHK